jgi:hypothetical protein
MAKITIIPSDGVVGVDGEFREIDMSGVAADIHAIQFNNGAGHIEYVNASKPNQTINSISYYQFLLDRWTAAAPQPGPEPGPPSIVSMRQARLALLQAGLLATVDAAIAAGGQADQITWEYATEVDRNSALVFNMVAALNLTSQQLDDLFTLAASL